MSFPTDSAIGLAAAATLSLPTGRLRASAADVPASSLEVGVVLATGRPQVSDPSLPQTFRPGEVVPLTGQSLAGVLRPTALPQNVPGPGQLSISGAAAQATQPPPYLSQLPPPTGLARASLAGALHATAAAAPEASIAQPPMSRATVFPHAIYRVPLSDGLLPSGQSQPCTLQPQICTARDQLCTQNPPPSTPTPTTVPPIPCTRRCAVNPAPTIIPVPSTDTVPVVAADNHLPDHELHNGDKPLPHQDDSIDDNHNDHPHIPPDNHPLVPVIPSNVDNDDANPLLPDAPNAPNAPSPFTPNPVPAPVPVPTGVVVVSASSSPPRCPSCLTRPGASCFLFSISLVVWGTGMVL